MSSFADKARRHLPGAASVAVATGLANLLGYALTVVAARVLAVSDFGAFAALLSMIIVGNVAAMAVQAQVARSVARGEATTGLVVLTSAGVVAGAVAIASPFLARALAVDTAAVVAMAVAVGALTAAAGPIGVAQGTERFVLLAALLLGQGSLRVAGGFLGVLVTGSATSAITGVAVGLAVAAAAGWLVAPVAHRGAGQAQARQVVHAAAVLLGFVLLSNVDVILARILLGPDQSGAYGAGAIITKVAFWLPQFIPVLAFARLSQRERHGSALRLALVAVLASGVVTVVAAAALATPIIRLVAGQQYLPVAPLLWRFALLGALLALGQVTVFSALARRDRATLVLVWLSLGALVLLVLPAATVGYLVTAAVGVAAALVAVTGVREMRVGSRAAQAPTSAPGALMTDS